MRRWVAGVIDHIVACDITIQKMKIEMKYLEEECRFDMQRLEL